MDAILGAGYAPGASLQLGAAGGGGGGGGGGMYHHHVAGADDVSANRIAAFATAQEVDRLLGTYAGTLRELVERVNATYGAAGRGDDALSSPAASSNPLELVRSTLESQMAALAYVDREAGALLAEARSLDAQLAMAGYAATAGSGGGGVY
jgi:hypothetical protein